VVSVMEIDQELT